MKIPPASLALLLTSAVITAVFAVSAPIAATSGTVDGAVDFTRDIRPILSEHCFPCHGPNEASRKAGLNLLHLESASAELESGSRAIVSGDRKKSEMWHLINDPDDPMPPPEEKNPLRATQIELIGRWIDAGAQYSPHWAYRPAVRSDLPELVEVNGPLTNIDRFIRKKLEEAGLEPAPQTDPVTLIRRLSFDLTGLPPTISELDQFLVNPDDDAYRQTIERLLQSPRFGERLASVWLDLVRYADTVGYHGDQEHRAWPYRDWVIAAFNSNMPYDRFTAEQIAGDLLEYPSQEQLIATGYNRLLQTSHEGGLQLGEYRAIYMADRVRNFSEVWLGATVGCAQCHDHKYDPFTVEDFYSLGAFFADIDDEDHIRNPYGGLNTTPTRRAPEMRVLTGEGLARRTKLESRISRLEREIESAIVRLEPLRSAWEIDLKERVVSGETQQMTWVDDVLETGGEVSGRWDFVREENIPPYSGELYRRQKSNGLVQHYTHKTTLKRITVAKGDVLFAWVYLLPDSPSNALMLQCNTSGNWEHRAVWGSDDIVYGRKEKSWPGYQRLGALPESGNWVRLEVPFKKIGIAAGTVVDGVAFTQFGGTTLWDLTGVESSQIAPKSVLDALKTPSAERDASEIRLLLDFQANQSPGIIALRQEKLNLEDQHKSFENSLPLTLFTRALKTPREVRILPAGNWLDDSGAIVKPAVPAFLGTIDTSGRATRLDLARWLILNESEGGIGSLTARVFVNRIWAMLFGEGLCPSVEDFGGQGRPVTHPQLLDHLALEFIASGWDIKELIRKMVLSLTYRQSSLANDASLANDPQNLLFSHQARYRLPAEMVRDTALSASGLLVEELGGPSVKPPQPGHYYRHLNFPPRRYKPDLDRQQWRRGVYLHWQRQYLHPMLLAFDAPVREDCTARRNRSNTPLAALVTLNDPVFVEAARNFAQRLLQQGETPDEELIAIALRTATSRIPTQQEISILTRLLDESREYFRNTPDRADQLLATGHSPLPDKFDPVELAALTEICRAVLNLHETINRD